MPPGRPRNPAEAADALRAAVDQTFQATFGRLATGDAIKDLREQVRKLEQRVEALEKAQTRSPDAVSGSRRVDRSKNRKRG
jgi:protein tyrosine phosphatase (PTP) superfamily phosphohydrolase (DUF442 family)